MELDSIQLNFEQNRFKKHTRREIYRHIQVHAFPICVNQNTQLLRSTECEDWDEDFTALFNSLVHSFQEISLSDTLWVANSRSVSEK